MSLIHTPRLTGRKLQSDDFSLLRQLHTNSLGMAELGGIRNEAKTKENLEWNLSHWERHHFGLWVFSINDNKIPVGLIGFRKIEFLNSLENDLAFMLLPQFWNCGYASEASKGVLNVASQVYRIQTMIAKTRKSNFASQRVIQKLGFTLEREIIDFDHPHLQFRLNLLC